MRYVLSFCGVENLHPSIQREEKPREAEHHKEASEKLFKEATAGSAGERR